MQAMLSEFQYRVNNIAHSIMRTVRTHDGDRWLMGHRTPIMDVSVNIKCRLLRQITTPSSKSSYYKNIRSIIEKPLPLQGQLNDVIGVLKLAGDDYYSVFSPGFSWTSHAASPPF